MHLIKYYYVYHVKEDKNDGAPTFYGIYEKKTCKHVNTATG
jgi:hypothetical protein